MCSITSILFILLTFHTKYSTSNLLEMIHKLQMKNLVIYTNHKNDTTDLFSLVKSLMLKNETILVTGSKDLIAKRLLDSPVIFMSQEEDILQRLPKIKRPVLFVENTHSYKSDIDEPLYNLHNNVLTESYKFKSLHVEKKLGEVVEQKFVWFTDIPEDFFERRGNLNQLLLICMTEKDKNNLIAKKSFKSIGQYKELPLLDVSDF